MKDRICEILFVIFVIFSVSLVETIQIADASTITVPGEHATIQDAINAASNGDTIEVKDGLYTRTSSLNLNKDGISIIGESESGTIIDVSSISGYGVNWTGNNISMKNFTFQSGNSDPNSAYPDSSLKPILDNSGYTLKISGTNDIVLENITVKDSEKTGVDLNGVNGATMTGITVQDTLWGFGINMVDSNDLTLTDITTSNNTWGGVSIQTFGKDHLGGSNNIKFTGTFNAQEDAGFFLEQDPCQLPSSFCSGGEFFDITNIQLPAKYNFAVFGIRNAESEDFKQTFYVETLSDAKSAGDLLATGSHTKVIVVDVPTPGGVQASVVNKDFDNLYVVPSMSITEALDASFTGNTINFDAGLYEIDSTITINKPLTLLGPQANIDPRTTEVLPTVLRTPGNSTTEAIITGPNPLLTNLISIEADNVTINGFEIKHGKGDLIFAPTGSIQNNTTVSYNIIHDSFDDEGIQLKETDNAIIESNHVFDTHGDGINLAFSNNGFIQSNEVYHIANHSESSGIYVYNDAKDEPISSQFKNLMNITIQNNLVYDVISNDGIKVGDKGGLDEKLLSNAKVINNIIHDTAQDGITVYTSNVIVDGNEIFNSASENGALYVSYDVHNITITDNNIHDNPKKKNESSGITYGIRVGKNSNQPTNVIINNNKILDNEAGLFYNFQTGNPSLDATNNYWGHVKGPRHSGNSQGNGDTITDNVLFDPWYLNSALGVLSDEISTEPGNDKKITPKSKKVKFDDGDDTTKVKGTAALPEDIVEIELNNDAVLDVNDNIEEKVGNGIDIGGATVDLTTFDIQTDDDDSTDIFAPKDLTQIQKVANVDIHVEKAVKLKSGIIAEPIIITNVDIPTVKVSIPDETTILAPAGWTGTIQPPKAASSSGTAPSGFSVGDTVIEVGSPDAVLLFDTPVTLTLEGVTGSVGYKPAGSTVWTQITESCGGTFDNPDAPSAFPGECFISNDSDTKIVTYHFTEFGGLDSTPPPTESPPAESPPAKSSSGGSGRINVSPQEMDRKSNTSLSRVSDWVSSSNYFGVGIRDLISQGYIAHTGKIPTSAPDWFYSTGQTWKDGKITDEEYFDAVKYLIDHKIIK